MEIRNKAFKKALADNRITAVSLQKGDGYLYFVYDDGERFDTHSVYVNSFSDRPLKEWVADAIAFNSEMLRTDIPETNHNLIIKIAKR